MIKWTIWHGYDEDADFEFGLNLILDGLARLDPAGRETGRRPRPVRKPRSD